MFVFLVLFHVTKLSSQREAQLSRAHSSDHTGLLKEQIKVTGKNRLASGSVMRTFSF